MRLRSLLALTLVLAGCSSGAPASVSAGGLSGSVGVLHVERTVAAREVEREPSAVLRAAFARYRGIEARSVLGLLGSGRAADLGRCVRVDPAGELGADDADVELLDVGALRVSVADTEAELTARTFPDLASVLAGVFYAGDAALSAPRPELDEYIFSADGSAEVGAFEVAVPAPMPPGGVALVGADGTGGPLHALDATELTTTAALTLLWEAEDPRDVVEIELSAGGQTLACAAADEGALHIAAADLAAVPSDPAARLIVRRVRLAPFDAPGIDVSYARVAAARVFPLSVR